ncbi:phenylacetate--CoA ligase family protein [Winogradskyella eckloniae]|uniref:phenylacetate--CoA ligase family protein n=1 Tax=Winogradskyella eckloniae TaxID=1089306 RepID=UPI00156610A3|nr:phenylacetate--CoA ligase family protein [Winogradskyella eckloniae]NRD18518.1 phenylacetate--CoA ligase family protein [Winogradskyella eckloniae]
MLSYNSFLNKIILPIGDVFFGGSYTKFLNEWAEYDKKTESELIQLQHTRLKSILEHASTHVPFYKNQTHCELDKFPILTKDVLRESVKDLVSNKHQISNLLENHSSGSTGVQSFTYMTKSHQFYLRALQTHWWTWSGYNIGDRLLQFGISQKRSFTKRLKDLFYRCDYVKAFGLSEEELYAISLRSSQRKNLYIAGYPSVINELAKSSLALKPRNIKGIICFGDKLFSHHINNISMAFGQNTKVLDTYGCAEGLLMACKKDLPYYYIMSPHVFIEIVDDNGKAVSDGEMGNVLVTCLTNYAMPLIRYKLGDLAIKLPKEEYPKNRELHYPLLKKIIGRETDVVKTKKGVSINVHSFTGIFEYYQDIKQFKIIQNDLENIEVEYILDTKHNSTTSALNEIKRKFYLLTDNSINISFRQVEVIKPSKSGKPQIIESNL